MVGVRYWRRDPGFRRILPSKKWRQRIPLSLFLPCRLLLSALASLLGAARGVLVCLVTLGLKQLGNCTRKRLETIDSTISWHALPFINA